jgi:hypothetical protein
VLPFQSAYAAFFVTTLIVMLTILRPGVLTSSYVFALIVNVAALAFSAYETLKAARLVYRD